jgi:hypothetical protein
MRLSQETILQMIAALNEGETRSVIAERFSVDAATVRYHEERFVTTYGSTRAVYSLIKPPPRPCEHPSLKCLICGKAQDHIHRRELEYIKQLRAQVVELGGEPVEQRCIMGE